MFDYSAGIRRLASVALLMTTSVGIIGSITSYRRSLLGLVAAALLLAACSSPPIGSLVASASPSAAPSAAIAGSPAVSPTPSEPPPPSALPSVSTSPKADASSATRPRCPLPGGNKCLGILAAGTYSTFAFVTPFAYTVPAGWANYSDIPGEIFLLAPGYELGGVDAGTSDYIGVYASVAADTLDCLEQPAPGVALSAKGIAHALVTRPGLATTAPKSVTVGGLKGLVLDVNMKKGWTKAACPGGANVAVLTGVSPSEFDHPVGGATTMRLYLFDTANGVLAIEVDDITGGKHLHGYDIVVKSMRFLPD